MCFDTDSFTIGLTLLLQLLWGLDRTSLRISFSTQVGQYTGYKGRGELIKNLKKKNSKKKI
jgi:hypothetical protein